MCSPNNTFWRNVGASVNIFGHAFNGGPPQTSRNLSIFGNIIAQNGCRQGLPPYFAGYPSAGSKPSSDVGAIAFDLPNGTGKVDSNLIFKCPPATTGLPPPPPLWGGDPLHRTGFTFVDNSIYEASQEAEYICSMPSVLWDTRVKQWPNLYAKSATDGATLRYTVDGSRPTESSPVWPPNSAVAASPAAKRTSAILVRAFKNGLAPSATNGFIRFV